MNLHGLKIGFLGDSITEGYGASSNDKCFVSLFKEKYKDSAIYNYGICGTRISVNTKFFFDERYEKNPFYTRLNIMEDDLDLIVVLGGTNDFGHGDSPLGELHDNTNHSFYGALENLYNDLVNKYPKARIIIVTPLHRYLEETTVRDNGTVRKPFKYYIKAIRDVASYFSFPVIDLFKISGIQPNIKIIKKTYTIDGLHPNDLGYKKIFDILDNELNKII